MFTKIRTVKPSYHSSRSISSVSVEAAYVGIALLALCDDEGYFEADPQVIKGSLFPRRNDIDFESSIKELEGIEFLEISSCSKGYPYGFIPNFSRDQIIRSDRFRSSEIKKLCKWKPFETDMTDTCPSLDSHLTDGNRKGNRNRKGKGNREKEKEKEKERGNESVSFSSLDDDLRKKAELIGGCIHIHPTKWSNEDLGQLRDLNPDLEECELMKRFYAFKGDDLEQKKTNLWKSGLSDLLNDWSLMLGRAKDRCEHASSSAPVTNHESASQLNIRIKKIEETIKDLKEAYSKYDRDTKQRTWRNDLKKAEYQQLENQLTVYENQLTGVSAPVGASVSSSGYDVQIGDL